jgi:hypothetical protein
LSILNHRASLLCWTIACLTSVATHLPSVCAASVYRPSTSLMIDPPLTIPRCTSLSPTLATSRLPSILSSRRPALPLPHIRPPP